MIEGEITKITAKEITFVVPDKYIQPTHWITLPQPPEEQER